MRGGQRGAPRSTRLQRYREALRAGDEFEQEDEEDPPASLLRSIAGRGRGGSPAVGWAAKRTLTDLYDVANQVPACFFLAAGLGLGRFFTTRSKSDS